MSRSKIPYCDVSAGNLNIVLGCTPVSEGCSRCFARANYERWGNDFSQIKMYPKKLAKLHRMRFPTEGNVRGPGSRPIAFVVDMGDLFHEAVTDQFILNALDIMASISHVDFLLLTKRAYRMKYLIRYWVTMARRNLPANIWPGVTAENDERFGDRWPPIAELATSGPKWVSVEPMLKSMDLCLAEMREHGDSLPDWIVCGAESGPNRRPFDKAWAIDLKRQCDEAGIAYFFKQSSGLYPGTDPTLEGREWKAWPQ